ncbi:MAG: DUF4157 domain-containing protein, partial [Gemmatimonadaceae bacterium]
VPAAPGEAPIAAAAEPFPPDTSITAKPSPFDTSAADVVSERPIVPNSVELPPAATSASRVGEEGVVSTPLVIAPTSASSSEPPIDPYVAHVLAVLRGDATESLVPPVGVGDAPTSSELGAERAAKQLPPSAARGDEAVAPLAESGPKSVGKSAGKSAGASATAPNAASSPPMPVAAASKDRFANESDVVLPTQSARREPPRIDGDAPTDTAVRAKDTAKAVEQTTPADAVAFTSNDNSPTVAEGVKSLVADAERQTKPPELVESTGQPALQLEAGADAALTLPAEAPAAAAASAPPSVGRASDAQSTHDVGNAPRDAEVREMRRARPLSPETVKRLAEQRGNEGTPREVRPSLAEPIAASEDTPPNASAEPAEPAPFDPMVWLERLREAARVEAAGGRDKLRAAQAKEGSDALATPRAPTAATRAPAAPSALTARPVQQGKVTPTSGDASVGAGTSVPATPSVAAASRGPTFVPARAQSTSAPKAASATPSVPLAREQPKGTEIVAPSARADAASADLTRAIETTPPVSLGEPARAFLRPLLGVDPGSISVHEGVDAGNAASARDADALAVGERILAPPAATTSSSPEALGLLAHEITHVARQRAPSFVPPIVRDVDATARGAREGGRAQPRGVARAGDGEEEIALVTEHAVRAQARARDRQHALDEKPNAEPSSPLAYSAPAWNAGDEPNAAWSKDASRSTVRDPYGGFPAPHEPLLLPEVWNTPRPRAGESSTYANATAPISTGESAESWGGASTSTSTGEGAPVQTAPSGRALDEDEHESPGEKHGDSGDKHGADGEQLDRLASQVYQVLRRRLLAERRRGG